MVTWHFITIRFAVIVLVPNALMNLLCLVKTILCSLLSTMDLLSWFYSVPFSYFLIWNYKVVCKWEHEIFWTFESRCHAFLLEKEFWVRVQLWEKIKSTFFSIIIQISYDKISLTHCIFLNKSHWGKFGLPCESDIFFMCARCCVQWHFTGTYFPDLYGPCVSLGFYILVDPVGTPPHSGTYSCEKQQQ